MFLHFFAIVFWTPRKSMVEVPITKAPIGDISGTSTVTRHGRDIFGYKGIPYEQPTNWKIEVQKASKHAW